MLILFTILAILFILLKKSKSNYFYRDDLKEVRKVLAKVLYSFGLNANDFLTAFDYFTNNPDKFDGATFVQDIHLIGGLDPIAMLHDWQYLTHPMDLKSKLKYDWQYSQNLRKVNVNWFIAYTRFFGLILLTPLYYTWKAFTDK